MIDFYIQRKRYWNSELSGLSLGVIDANAQPSSPGEILKEWIDGNSITEVAQRLNITGDMLSRISNGKANISDISAEMAIRLSILLGTSSELWLGMQEQYDLWRAKQRKHDFVIPSSQPLNKQAKNDL